MKLNPSDIKKAARNLFRQRTHVRAPKLVHPRRDWTIGLLVGVTLLVGVASWSAYMYVTNRIDETIQLETEVVSVPVYRAAIVAEALEFFAAREQALETITSRQPTIQQPEATAETTEDGASDEPEDDVPDEDGDDSAAPEPAADPATSPDEATTSDQTEPTTTDLEPTASDGEESTAPTGPETISAGAESEASADDEVVTPTLSQ